MDGDQAGSSSPAATPPIRVGAVDDHPAILTGLRYALEDLDPTLCLTATAATVPELLARGLQLDVVLLDLRLGDGSQPRDNVAALLAAGAQVVVYSEGSHRAAMDEAVRAGALGLLRKDEPVTVVAEALRAVAAGDPAGSAALAQLLHSDAPLHAHLSDREIEVLRLYAAGLPAKSVARRVGVHEVTAKEYLKRIRAKYAALGRPAGTRSELYARAIEDGILDPFVPGPGI